MKNKLKLIITKSAQDDIRGIVSYIALDNKTAALKFAKVIKNTFVYLSDYPNMGRKDLSILMKMFYFSRQNGVII